MWGYRSHFSHQFVMTMQPIPFHAEMRRASPSTAVKEQNSDQKDDIFSPSRTSFFSYVPPVCLFRPTDVHCSLHSFGEEWDSSRWYESERITLSESSEVALFPVSDMETQLCFTLTWPLHQNPFKFCPEIFKAFRLDLSASYLAL